MVFYHNSKDLTMTAAFFFLMVKLWIPKEHLYHPFPTPTLSVCLWAPSTIHDHLFNNYCYKCVYICIHNLLSVFRIIHIHTCPRLAIRGWITYQGAHHRRMLILPLSSPWPSVALHLGMGAHGISPWPCWHVSWPCHYHLFRVDIGKRFLGVVASFSCWEVTV